MIFLISLVASVLFLLLVIKWIWIDLPVQNTQMQLPDLALREDPQLLRMQPMRNRGTPRTPRGFAGSRVVAPEKEIQVLKRRCVVVGGAGVIGRAVVDTLIADNDVETVVVLDLRRRTCAPYSSRRVEYHVGDVRNPEDVLNACRGAQSVFHCAALNGYRCSAHRQRFFDVNVVGTLNVVNACVKCGVSNLVFASCAAAVNSGWDEHNVRESLECSKPLGSVGSTKSLAERLVIASNGHCGLRTIVLRAPTVLDVRERHGIVRSAVVLGLRICAAPRKKNPVQSFVLARSFAAGLILADRKLDETDTANFSRLSQVILPGSTFFLCDFVAPVYDVVQALALEQDRTRRVVSEMKFKRIIGWVAVFMDWLFGYRKDWDLLYMTPDFFAIAAQTFVISSRRAAFELGWKSSDMKTAVRALVADFEREKPFLVGEDGERPLRSPEPRTIDRSKTHSS